MKKQNKEVRDPQASRPATENKLTNREEQLIEETIERHRATLELLSKR